MIGKLEAIAKKIRIETLKSLTAAKSGHTGGSLGLADVFTVLYFHQMRHNPSMPDWENRDRLILSIGHVAPVLYSSLALSGYFPIDELQSLRKLNSRLQGHPGRNHGLPGLELSAGSLGQGLSVAVGMALAAKHKNQQHNIYCITGDGELQEGSIWEAAMSAGHFHLDNLITLIDRNGVQIDGSTEDVMALEPLDKKWEAFGWDVFHCDGNNIADLIKTYNKAIKKKGKPKVIIAKTIMGKGVSEIEGNYKWHGKAPNKKELEVFLKYLS